MFKKELKKYFEEKILKGTCFDNLNELLKDKTDIYINAPRALIAVELKGFWRGITQLNNEKTISISKIS